MILAKNLKYLRVKNNLTQDILADQTHCKRNAYKEYEYNRTPPVEVLIKLSDYYQVSIDTLLKADIEELDIRDEEYHKNAFGRDFRVLAISVDEDDNEFIDFVPERAKAGYLSGYSNPTYIETLPRFRLPNLPVGTFRAFEIDGDSMPPLSSKSIVIGRYVENWNFVKNLETYILITKDDGIVYKRVISKAKKHGKIILISDNPHFEPYSIDVGDILEIWSYHCHIGFYGNDSYQKMVLKQVLEMSDEVEELEEMISKRRVELSMGR